MRIFANDFAAWTLVEYINFNFKGKTGLIYDVIDEIDEQLNETTKDRILDIMSF